MVVDKVVNSGFTIGGKTALSVDRTQLDEF